MGKAEGEAEGCHCGNSSFISIVVGLFVRVVVFLSFSSSSPYKGTTSVWIEYRTTLLVCLCLRVLFHVDLWYDYFYAGREKKATEAGLFRCQMTVNSCGATRKRFHA